MSTLRVDEIRNVDDILGDGEVKIFGEILSGANGDKRTPNIDDFLASPSANGYQYLPSGIIVQWGIFNMATQSSVSVPLNIAYPNNFHFVSVTLASNITGNCVTIGGSPTSLSHFESTTSATSGGTYTFAWISFGN